MKNLIFLALIACLGLSPANVLTMEITNKPTQEALNASLFEAAISKEPGNVSRLSALVNQGAQTNATDKSGKTPLHAAAQYGTIDSVRFLLQFGANKNERDIFGKTPADYAHSDEIKTLIETFKRGWAQYLIRTYDRHLNSPAQYGEYHGREHNRPDTESEESKDDLYE